MNEDDARELGDLSETDARALGDAVAALLPPLLHTLSMLELGQRHLHPPQLGQLGAELAPRAEVLGSAADAFLDGPAWPAALTPLRDRLLEAATAAAGACQGLAGLGGESADFIAAIRALRRQTRALELLLPLAATLPPLSRFFLERALDEAVAAPLVARIAETAEADGGLVHQDNERLERGGFSLFVPRWVGADTPMPLIVALHGGSGHGRDFIWSWLREARTRGCMVLAPTSADRTWSMTGGEDVDAPRLLTLVAALRERFAVDQERILLTGMSDGATYALLTGLRDDSPFTALAPSSGVLSPELVADGRIARARGLPIRLLHGALDWMFPVDMARDACATLEGAGAEVTYREIEDLSHCFAREEVAATLDWLGVPRDRAAGLLR